MTLRHWRAPALSVVLAALSSQNAPAAEIGAFEEAGWRGAVYADDSTGLFSNCLVTAEYRSGATLAFQVTRDYLFRVALSHPGWLFRVNADVPAIMKIDRAAPLSGSGLAIERSTVVFPVEATETNYNLFRRGRLLTVFFDGKTYEFYLDGTARALAKLLDCVEIYSKTETATAPQPTAPADDMRLAQRVEATEIAANVASTAGLTGFQIVSDADLRSQLGDPDVLWTATGLIGSANILDNVAEFTIEEVAALRAAATDGCEGGKNTATKRETVNGQDIVSVMIECRPLGSDPLLIRRTLVPRSAGGYFEFGVILLPNSGNTNSPPPTESFGNDITNAALVVLTQK